MAFCQRFCNWVCQPPLQLRGVAVYSHRLVNQRPLPVLGAAHNTRSSRHSTKSSGMWTSRPRFTLFPITSNLVYSEWERLRQPHGHRRSHRPGGPPHHYPRVRRPQLPHRCGPAAGSGTEGESQSPVNRHPPAAQAGPLPTSTAAFCAVLLSFHPPALWANFRPRVQGLALAIPPAPDGPCCPLSPWWPR